MKQAASTDRLVIDLVGGVRDARVMADTKMIKTIGEHWVCATLARYKWAPR